LSPPRADEPRHSHDNFRRSGGRKLAVDVMACWTEAYATNLSSACCGLPDVKNVNFTNFCDIAVRDDVRTDGSSF